MIEGTGDGFVIAPRENKRSEFERVTVVVDSDGDVSIRQEGDEVLLAKEDIHEFIDALQASMGNQS